MNDNVVPFKPKEVDTPHLIGTAYCITCMHQWEATAPAGTVWLACPNCLGTKGRYLFYAEPDTERWQCSCGCQLFYVSRTGVFCPNCGKTQRFPE